MASRPSIQVDFVEPQSPDCDQNQLNQPRLSTGSGNIRKVSRARSISQNQKNKVNVLFIFVISLIFLIVTSLIYLLTVKDMGDYWPLIALLVAGGVIFALIIILAQILKRHRQLPANV